MYSPQNPYYPYIQYKAPPYPNIPGATKDDTVIARKFGVEVSSPAAARVPLLPVISPVFSPRIKHCTTKAPKYKKCQKMSLTPVNIVPSPIMSPILLGGSKDKDDEYYKMKYLKYKAKYMQLKAADI